MRIYLLFISVALSIVFNMQVAATSCDNVLYDTFDADGALPSDWTEYNTSGSVTVVDGALRFIHSTSKPGASRTFTSISEDVTFSFDVSATKNYVSSQIDLISSTGQYLSSIDIGAKSSSIKHATSLSSGAPSGFTDASPKVVFFKNTTYSLSARINFTTQMVDYYADGILMMADVPFLQSATNVAKIDVQTLFMYDNNGYFYFDNIVLSKDDENRLLLSNTVTASEALLASAVVGNAGGEYSQEAYDAFAIAINTSIGVEQNCSAFQSAVDQTLEDLETAVTIFKASSVAFVESVSINALDTRQEIVMIGGDMERNAPALQFAPNKYSIIEWLIIDIPFNTYRVKYDKLQEMTEGDLDMDGTYAEQVLTMKLILLANPEMKFFATMKSDYHGYSGGNRNNLPTFIYDYAYDKTTEEYSGTKAFDAVKYGRFLADYIEYMSDNDVPISYLSTSKEWTQVMTAARAKTAIETMINILTTRNIEMPLIIDPGAWSINQGYNTVKSYVSSNVNQYVYGYSTHNYSSSDKTWSDFATAANNAGKSAIDDESGHGGGGPTNGAYEQPITNAISTYSGKCDMYAGGIQGELFFELWMGNFKYARPIMFSETENGRRMRSYYIMKKFVENVRDAIYVNSTLNNFNNVSSMAFIQDKSLVLWMINSSETSYSDFAIDINNLELKKGMTVQQVYWDSTSVITGVEEDIIAHANDQFNADIAPRSINCFVIAPYSNENSELLSNETIKSPETIVSVYPNPTMGLLNINTSVSISSITVFDINGRQVNSMMFSDKSIDLSGLEDGIYFLAIETAKSQYTIRVIKD